MKKARLAFILAVLTVMLITTGAMASEPQNNIGPFSSDEVADIRIAAHCKFSDAQINSADAVSDFSEFQNSSKTLTKDQIICGMVTSLLIGKTQAENSYTSVSFQKMLGSAGYQKLDPSLVFFMQKAELFKSMRQIEDIKITDQELKYEFLPIVYSGTNASVDVKEIYAFQINSITERSTVETEYHITLTYDSNNKWIVKTITSNDWFEDCKDGKPFNVAEELAHMTVEKPETDHIVFSSEPQKKTVAPATIVMVDFVNGSRVYNYAKTFWSSYNSVLYGNYNPSGGDCMNFASQCLAVGLGFSSDPTSIANGSAPCDNVGNYTWIPKITGSPFISCGAFRTYLGNNTSETGLFGTVFESHSSTVTCSTGDVVHTVNSSGDPYGHAAVVIAGGTSRSTILVSAHNNNRDAVTMAYMCGSARTCQVNHITGFKTYASCTMHYYTNVGAGNGTDSICDSCGFCRLRLNPSTFEPFARGSTKTITATTNISCYRIAVCVTAPSGGSTWLPAVMNSSSFSGTYTFSETGIYTVTVSARDTNDSLPGSIAKSMVYQVRVT